MVHRSSLGYYGPRYYEPVRAAQPAANFPVEVGVGPGGEEEGEDRTADATTTTTTTTTTATTTTALLLSKQPDEALFGVQLGQDTTEAKQAKPLVVENRKWSMRPSGCGLWWSRRC